jgi:hypothetical protein
MLSPFTNGQEIKVLNCMLMVNYISLIRNVQMKKAITINKTTTIKLLNYDDKFHPSTRMD